MILQHHLLLQTSSHHHRLDLNIPLHCAKVFHQLIILIIYMLLLLIVTIYFPYISLLSILWIMGLFLSLKVKLWLITIGNKQCWQKWVLWMPTTHWSLLLTFFLPPNKPQLSVDQSIQWRFDLVALLIIRKLTLWLGAILKFYILIMITLFLLWPKSPFFGFFLSWSPSDIGLYTSWT